MKLLRFASLFSLFAALGWLSAGCAHAQVPPKSNAVALSWSAPSGCTSGCSYVVSRIALASGTASCPAPNVTTPNYTPLNQASPVTATAYTDAGAGALTVCYIAQTELGGSVSQPSNTAGPFVVPANAIAPAIIGQTTSAELAQPMFLLPSPQLAGLIPGHLAGTRAGE